MKKVVTTGLILICLLASGIVYVRPALAQYQGGFTINADGSVSPLTAPIQQSGNVYTLTSNVDGSITIDRNCIVFNGNGQTVSGGEFGIVISASNVTVANTTITDTGENVLLPGPPASMGNPTAGIFITGSSNVVTQNSLSDNICGLALLETSHNLIVGNNITGSSVVAFDFYESSNNTIYHNNIISNANNVEDDSFGFEGAISVNTWDDGYPAGGNYWGYQTGKEIDNTGISDTPYQIKPYSILALSGTPSQNIIYQAKIDAAYINNTDRYPLVEPFNASFLLNYAQEITPPKILVLSPLNQTYRNSTVSLVLTVDKSVSWIGYSLDREQNVTITGNRTITDVTYGLHSITVYVNDTFGILGASQTINFTVAKPEALPTVTVALVSGAVAAVVVAAGLLVYFKKRKRQV